jgi:hypothetical protein
MNIINVCKPKHCISALHTCSGALAEQVKLEPVGQLLDIVWPAFPCPFLQGCAAVQELYVQGAR